MILATTRQKDMIRELMDEIDEVVESRVIMKADIDARDDGVVPSTIDELTVAQASDVIDWLLDEKRDRGEMW